MEEDRTEEILKSLEGIQRAKAPARGFMKIQKKLAQRRQGHIRGEHPSKFWMSIAATITLITCINIWTVLTHQSDVQAGNEVAEEYQIITTDFNFYSYE